MRAEIVTARCAGDGSLYGMRMQEADRGTWLYTWTFRLREQTAEREGYGGGEIAGTLEMAPEWPGCPHCRSESFVRCGACGKVTCHATSGGSFRCRWCDNRGEISGTIDRLSARDDG